MADAAVGKKPNYYDLSGDGIHVTYATTTFQGQPVLIYQDSHTTKKFTGSKEIRTVATEIGTLVTVTLQIVVDAASTSFSVMIPTVNLAVADTSNVDTFGVTTLHKSTIIGPPLQGQTEVYTTHELKGTAQFRVFAAAANP